jgi:hypothetical protein
MLSDLQVWPFIDSAGRLPQSQRKATTHFGQFRRGISQTWSKPNQEFPRLLGPKGAEIKRMQPLKMEPFSGSNDKGASFRHWKERLDLLRPGCIVHEQKDAFPFQNRIVAGAKFRFFFRQTDRGLESLDNVP